MCRVDAPAHSTMHRGPILKHWFPVAVAHAALRLKLVYTRVRHSNQEADLLRESLLKRMRVERSEMFLQGIHTAAGSDTCRVNHQVPKEADYKAVTVAVSICIVNRVPTAQGKQGKWPKKIPVREFGNFVKTQGILSKHRRT